MCGQINELDCVNVKLGVNSIGIIYVANIWFMATDALYIFSSVNVELKSHVVEIVYIDIGRVAEAYIRFDSIVAVVGFGWIGVTHSEHVFQSPQTWNRNLKYVNVCFEIVWIHQMWLYTTQILLCVERSDIVYWPFF